MSNSSIKFHSLVIHVLNLEKAIQHYARMGFQLCDQPKSNNARSVCMKLAECDEFMIRLVENTGVEAAERTQVIVELRQREDEIGEFCLCYGNAFQELLDSDVAHVFQINETETGIEQVARVKNRDGLEWNLVSFSEWP